MVRGVVFDVGEVLAAIQRHDPDAAQVPTMRIDGLDELPGRIATVDLSRTSEP